MRIWVDSVYVYAHSFDGMIFYIGKGSAQRMLATTNRNAKWCEIVKENGGVFDLEVIARFDTDAEAKSKETSLIRTLRPRANLVHNGLTRSDAHKAAIGAAQRGKVRSKETRARMAAAHRERHLKRQNRILS